ncbi:hypothetical protein K503DRAFT_865559 [Rhizopogon vinicolor AM-OR11-026]|uniref:Uncharacterized protein n=1 Tax=Rhizopogon vinicolor AM-OR11-026 TaxID=1314800 RepID=A0A1B7N310_9AGAM|nr:hypothetical protein K503DRAFT_865559 [Rhizopogon vinicolor AM-OR11-026]
MASGEMFNPESVSDHCLSSSSVTGTYDSPPSSRSPEIDSAQHVEATMDISSSSRNPSNYDVATLSQVLLGVRATATSPSSTDRSHATSNAIATQELVSPETTTKPSFSPTWFTHSHAYGYQHTDRGHFSETWKSHPTFLPLPVPSSISSTTPATSSSGVWVTGESSGIASGHSSSGPTPTAAQTTVVTSFPYTTVIVSGASSPSSSGTNTALTITSEWTSGGHTYETTVTLESMNPNSVHPTATSATTSSESSRLAMILGPVLGVSFLVALGVIFCKCCTYRQRASRWAQLTTQSPQSSHGDQRRLLRDTTPSDATPTLLGGQIFTPPPARTRSNWRRSQADNSLQISQGQAVTSNPFENDSFRDCSQTTEFPRNNHRDSIESVSTRMYFLPGSGAESEIFRSISTLETTVSSELNFVVPVPSDTASTYSSYFSPTGHYRARPEDKEEKSLEQDDNNILPSYVPGTFLPAASARLRALLDEARRS